MFISITAWFLKIRKHFLWQVVAFLIIFFILFKNTRFLAGGYIYGQMINREIEYIDFPPGRAFLPLVPYIKKYAVVGYYTDQYDEDFWFSPLVRKFQRAQYSLAPTVLDAEQWSRHRVVICYCETVGCEKIIQEKYQYYPRIQLGPNIILMEKGE